MLGAQVPDVLAERIFCIFASVVSSRTAKYLEESTVDQNSMMNASDVDEISPDKMDF